MTMNKKQLRDILLLQNEKIAEEEFLIDRKLLKNNGIWKHHIY